MYITVRKPPSSANPSTSGSSSTVSPLNTTRGELEIKIEELETKLDKVKAEKDNLSLHMRLDAVAAVNEKNFLEIISFKNKAVEAEKIKHKLQSEKTE